MAKYKLVLWGTGRRTQRCLDGGYFSSHQILGIVDNYKKEEMFYGIPVYTAEALTMLMKDADYLVIMPAVYNEILKQCQDFYVELSKIVILTNVSGTFFSECFSRLRSLSEPLYQYMKTEEYRIIHTNLSDGVDEHRLIGNGKYAGGCTAGDYLSDYFRFRTFEFVAREIKERNISGALAEFGVFQGTFAALINEVFPTRKLYLFDTFESFDRQEFERERIMGRCDSEMFESHARTSEDLVKSRLPHIESCIVCKGLFPKSIPDEAKREHFAFVSLDVDFEDSTYQGLNFFYPRLSENGYIFLHDYTEPRLVGVREAVMRYERDNDICMRKVPIADRGGTLIITK